MRYETPDEVLTAFTLPDGSLDVHAMAEAICVLQHGISALEYEMSEELQQAKERRNQ